MVAPRARASVNNIMHFDTCNNAGDRATFAAASSDTLSLLGFDGCSLALIDELIRKGTHLPYCPPFGSTIGMEQREAISLEFGYILNGLDSLTYASARLSQQRQVLCEAHPTEQSSVWSMNG